MHAARRSVFYESEVLPEINFSVVFAFDFIFNEDAQLARHMLSSGLSGFNTHLPKQNCFNFC